MRLSQLFTKTRKEVPKDEASKNAQLLIRAGFIHKEMAGVYSYLPLGLKVLKKIEVIIREEMNAIGGQELIMTALQSKEKWKKSGRWDDEVVDVWFKTKLKNDTEIGLGFTHDEQLVEIVREYINSYKDIPFYPYQIQTKFRNELRAKSGIMRGREFVMKDLYSFNHTLEEQDEFYEKIQKAYMNVYTRCGIGNKTYFTFASGGTFSKYSHEFQTVSDAGEDTIFIDESMKLAINQEVHNDEVLKDLGVDRTNLVEYKAIEVGNIFKQGTKFTSDLLFEDESGNKNPVYMGGYGIGVTRLMGTIVEVLSDSNGMVWPNEIAPAKIHMVALDGGHKETEVIYKQLLDANVEVLYDDLNDKSAGEKFADADLIGCPFRLVISKKSLQSGKVELKRRTSNDIEMIELTNLINVLKY